MIHVAARSTVARAIRRACLCLTLVAAGLWPRAAHTQDSPSPIVTLWTQQQMLRFSALAVAPGRLFTSPLVRAPQPLTMISADPGVVVRNAQVRVLQTVDGRAVWSSWQALALPTRGEGRSLTSTLLGPLWLSRPATAVQVRLTLPAVPRTARLLALRHLPDLRVVLAGVPAARVALPAAGTMPIVPRALWGAPTGENSPDWQPFYQAPTHFVIHHTDGPNTQNDVQGQLQGIWAYHTYAQGWGDIGYNYLIDRAGTVYEGRAGGAAGDAVVGAHTALFNKGTIGIALMGNYSSVSPPTDQWGALVRLIATLANRYGIDPVGSGPNNGLTYADIVGHSDLYATSCPGDLVYTQLALLRAEVKRLVIDGATQVGGGQTLSLISGGSALLTIRNTGTTTWNGAYHLVLLKGDALGLPTRISLPDVAPGTTLGIPLSLAASSGLSAGQSAASYWQMANASNIPFGGLVRLIVRRVAPTVTPPPTAVPSSTLPTPPLPTRSPPVPIVPATATVHPTATPTATATITFGWLPTADPLPATTATGVLPPLPGVGGLPALPTPPPTLPPSPLPTRSPTSTPSVPLAFPTATPSLLPPTPTARPTGRARPPISVQSVRLADGRPMTSRIWYSAAVSTSPLRRDVLGLWNPQSATAHVWISLADPTGPVAHAVVTIAPRSMQRLDLGTLAYGIAALGVTIQSDQPIAVAHQLDQSDAIDEGTASVRQAALPAPAAIWYVARTAVHPHQRQSVILYNPTGRAVHAAISSVSTGGTQWQRGVVIAAGTVLSLTVPSPAGLLVRAMAGGQLVVGEQSGYSVDQGLSAFPAQTTASTTPAVPIDQFGPGEQDVLTVLNPGSVAATVALRALAGQRPLAVLTVPPASQRSVTIGGGRADWVLAHSTAPIVLGREALLPPSAEQSLVKTGYRGSSDVAAQAAPVASAAFALGDTSMAYNGARESLSLANPSNNAVLVIIHTATSAGQQHTDRLVLPPLGQRTVSLGAVAGQQRHATWVNATQPILIAQQQILNDGVVATDMVGSAP